MSTFAFHQDSQTEISATGLNLKTCTALVGWILGCGAFYIDAAVITRVPKDTPLLALKFSQSRTDEQISHVIHALEHQIEVGFSGKGYKAEPTPDEGWNPDALW